MEKLNIKKNFRILCLLLKIETKNWFQGPMNLILGFGIALYIMVCWLVFKEGDPFLLVSGISVGVIRNGMFIYTRHHNEYRDSGMVNRLNQTSIPNYIRMLASLLFNLITTLGVSIVMFLVGITFFPDQRVLAAKANWAVVFTALTLVWLTSFVMGVFIFTFFKNSVISQMISILIYSTSTYFLGLGFPIDVILNPDYEWFGYILYAWPHRYAINLAQAGFANDTASGSILIIKDLVVNQERTISVNFGFDGKIWLAYLGAFLTIAFYGSLSIIKISNEIRFHRKNQYGLLVMTEESSKYVHQIKNAKNINELTNIYKARDEELRKMAFKTNQMTRQIRDEMRLLEANKKTKHKE
ncbi:ABC transporter permease [Williamsoniiplasma luminosum]|uniref:ABC transporter permease n=1 Tax=Williamsoniiplasma luminosum TaxID=214888 RepID=A0A2K8NTJ7_9MOLU|nr:ABC transporter permease [Williamsoniiplasma luminosum]ATZ17162.1 ABC transporter permease [Williamsoniiplasma luminosum]